MISESVLDRNVKSSGIGSPKGQCHGPVLRPSHLVRRGVVFDDIGSEAKLNRSGFAGGRFV